MLWWDFRARMRGTMKPTKAIQKVWRRIFAAARIFNIILPSLQVGGLAQRFEVDVWTFILQKKKKKLNFKCWEGDDCPYGIAVGKFVNELPV